MSRKSIHRLRKLWGHCKSGYLRVWIQSRFFPLSRGVFPPLWLAAKGAYPQIWRTDDRPHSLLAVGGKLTEDSLLAAYKRGINPLCDRRPIQWVVFNPRMVLFSCEMRLQKGWRRLIRSGRYNVTFDTAFEDVVRVCSDREYTWLVPERIGVELALHKRGQAHSVEVWNQEGCLVGGLFGMDMGRMFIVESAFSKEKNAMKVAFIYLNCHLQHWGYKLHDAQAYSSHFDMMGFEEIPLKEYMRLLKKLTGMDIRYGMWKVDEDLDVGEWIPSSPGSQEKKACSVIG